MRELNRSTILFAAWAAIFLLQASQIHVLAAEPDRITVDQLKVILEGPNDVIVVDVRSADSYEDGHIPGAVSIPSGEMVARHEELPLDRTLILY